MTPARDPQLAIRFAPKFGIVDPLGRVYINRVSFLEAR